MNIQDKAYIDKITKIDRQTDRETEPICPHT